MTDSPDTSALRLDETTHMALIHRLLGHFGDAEALLQQVIRSRESGGERDPKLISARHSLALVYWDQNRFDEAEPLFTSVLEARREVLSPKDPEIFRPLNN